MGITNGNGSSMAAKYNLPSHFIGGNALESASPSSVKDFVAAHDGHSVITSVWLPRLTAAPAPKCE
jgi:acetyl-CoA carboxylase/biotin carboxylase 1